jgi:ElaB/YqjD/DUF883 family membrane-anchored ribosome-binding protein
MSAQTATNSVHHLFDEQFDALKSGVKRIVDRATTKPTWFGRMASKTGETIKAHPIAAIGVALGLGYVIMRVVRR